jgi:hypothetical protein
MLMRSHFTQRFKVLCCCITNTSYCKPGKVKEESNTFDNIWCDIVANKNADWCGMVDTQCQDDSKIQQVFMTVDTCETTQNNKAPVALDNASNTPFSINDKKEKMDTSPIQSSGAYPQKILKNDNDDTNSTIIHNGCSVVDVGADEDICAILQKKNSTREIVCKKKVFSPKII